MQMHWVLGTSYQLQRGRAKRWWGGGLQVKLYPYQNREEGVAEQSFSHAERGGVHKTFWDSFNVGARGFSH